MKAFEYWTGYCIAQQTLYKKYAYNNSQMLSFWRHLTTSGIAIDEYIIPMLVFSFQCKQKNTVFVRFIDDEMIRKQNHVNKRFNHIQERTHYVYV